MVWGSVIGAVGSLIGADRARSAQNQAIDKQNAYNDPAAYRARMENAGFNPLAQLGQGIGVQQSAGDFSAMGRGISDAALLLGDGLDDHLAEISENKKLSDENEELKKQIKDQKLNPRVAGGMTAAKLGAGPAGKFLSSAASPYAPAESPRAPAMPYHEGGDFRVLVHDVLTGNPTYISQSQAKQFNLSEGDDLMGSAREEILSGTAGEFASVAALAVGAVNGRGILSNPRFFEYAPSTQQQLGDVLRAKDPKEYRERKQRGVAGMRPQNPEMKLRILGYD